MKYKCDFLPLECLIYHGDYLRVVNLVKLIMIVPFFISVEGQSYSNHRNPQGVYSVEVEEEKTIAHSACAAIQVARDCIPFIGENPESLKIRVFGSDGCEVVIARPLFTSHENRGLFMGRCKSYPESIMVQ
jgi:hypothetical protein